MKQAAAVLDWDGTLRRGYEIVDWTNFLDESGRFDHQTADRQRDLVSNYLAGAITYTQAVFDVAVIYAEGITGRKVQDTLTLAARFAKSDDAIFDFTPALFDLLIRNDVKIVLISNTPQVLLEEYKKLFTLTEVHGLQIGEQAGSWMNQVIMNPGLSQVKKRVVADLAATYDILVGMGDTHEDAPLLESAKVRLFLKPENKPHVRIPEVPELKVVDNDTVMETFERTLKNR